jgi:hypothetical protein
MIKMLYKEYDGDWERRIGVTTNFDNITPSYLIRKQSCAIRKAQCAIKKCDGGEYLKI